MSKWIELKIARNKQSKRTNVHQVPRHQLEEFMKKDLATDTKYQAELIVACLLEMRARKSSSK